MESARIALHCCQIHTHWYVSEDSHLRFNAATDVNTVLSQCQNVASSSVDSHKPGIKRRVDLLSFISVEVMCIDMNINVYWRFLGSTPSCSCCQWVTYSRRPSLSPATARIPCYLATCSGLSLGVRAVRRI